MITASLLAFAYAVLVGLRFVNPVESQSIRNETNTIQQLLNRALAPFLVPEPEMTDRRAVRR